MMLALRDSAPLELLQCLACMNCYTQVKKKPECGL